MCWMNNALFIVFNIRHIFKWSEEMYIYQDKKMAEYIVKLNIEVWNTL